MAMKDHELCISICEHIEKYTYIATNPLMREMGYASNQRTEFCKHLYGLETVKIILKDGRKRFKWFVADDWRKKLESGFKGGGEIESGDYDHTKCKEQQASDRVLIMAANDAISGLRTEINQLKADLALKQKTQKIVIELRRGKKKKVVKDLVHKQFKKIMQLTAARKHVLMVGPAGCGKSYLAQQIQEHMGLRTYGHINCSIGMSEGQIVGRLLPTGKSGAFTYHTSTFVDIYENGGLFLMDEIDAADPNVLIVINTALANGRMAVINRTTNPYADRHDDFVFMAAANTYGKGADRQYVGRNELDEATLDRFRIGTVELDYDDGLDKTTDKTLPSFFPPTDWLRNTAKIKSLESELCPNDRLRCLFQWYRHQIKENRLERVLSTRFLIDAYDMVEAGWSIEDCEVQFFSGWSPDEIRRVRTMA